MSLDTSSETRSFGGRQITYGHASSATGTPMRLAVFLPPQAERGPVPVFWFLAGLTCTEGQLHAEGRRAARRGRARPRARRP